jgi:type VI secretion system protein ImpE
MTVGPAMQAKAQYDVGQLSAAIETVTRGVKGSPGDTQLRTFLFELLCFAGEWERADRQLDVIGHQGTAAEIGVQVYRNCIKAERDRHRLISDGLAPHFLTEPLPYVDLHLDAVSYLRAGDTERLTETLQRAEEERPALAGLSGERIFQDFRDYDDLLGPVLELIVQDKYTWLPLDQIQTLTIDPPKQLRDLLWSPASITTPDKDLRAFIPNLYVGSSMHPDDQVKLGRMTDWKQIGEDIYQGVGLRLFAVDGEEAAIFDIKSLSFDPHESQAASPVM